MNCFRRMLSDNDAIHLMQLNRTTSQLYHDHPYLLKQFVDGMTTCVLSIGATGPLRITRMHLLYIHSSSTAIAMATYIQNNSSLVHLTIDYYETRTHAIKLLGIALHQHPSLQTLILSNTFMNDIGADAIANALKVNIVLKQLSLENDKITLNGATSLANALAHNRTLKHLDLSGNELGAYGANLILQNSGSSGLQHLNLSHTGIEDFNMALQIH